MRFLATMIIAAHVCTAASSLAQSASSGEKWTKLTEEDGVLVETSKRASGQTYIRGSKVLPFSFERVRKTLAKVASYTDWLPSTDVWQVLVQNEQEAFIYVRHNLSWPLKDRDYRVRYTWKMLPDGRFKVVAKSSTKHGPGPIRDVIRLTTVHSVWTLSPKGKSQTAIEYRYEGTLGGDLPDFLVRSAWKSEPVSILNALEQWLAATAG